MEESIDNLPKKQEDKTIKEHLDETLAGRAINSLSNFNNMLWGLGLFLVADSVFDHTFLEIMGGVTDAIVGPVFEGIGFAGEQIGAEGNEISGGGGIFKSEG